MMYISVEMIGIASEHFLLQLLRINFCDINPIESHLIMSLYVGKGCLYSYYIGVQTNKTFAPYHFFGV